MSPFLSTEDLFLRLCLTPGLSASKVRNCFEKIRRCSNQDLSKLRLSKSSLSTLGFEQNEINKILQFEEDSQKEFTKIKNISDKLPLRFVLQTSPVYPNAIESFMSSSPFYFFLYGNVPLLRAKKFAVVGSQGISKERLTWIETTTESGVLKGETLVVGANTDAYKRAAVVPLRWGAPRIIILDRGIFTVLGENLDQEMFPAARLWRYKFDPNVDLVISFCRPSEPHRLGANKIRDELVFAIADRIEVAHMRPGGTMSKLVQRANLLGKPVNLFSGN